ncbi:MAG: methyltransferase domain-containing protein [Thermoplasmata archaeon]|nr:methyltransferase domain-containing protein [Thermoplasmata archaeon]
MSVNRGKWDESVPLHFAAPSYDVPSFLRGRSTLKSIEVKSLGSVKGETLLHLQCHFGLDTLSWARRGARVTGVDFSLPAVRTARRLARRAGIKARFLQSNIYDLSHVLDDQFDIVYTGRGALCWLPDIDRWAATVARFLKPGGRFLLLEDHPITDVFPNDPPFTGLEPKIPYFTSHALREVYDGTYATSAKMKHRVTYSWIHPVSKVLSSLIRHGVEIEAVEEFPYTFWQRFSTMTEDRLGYWHFRENEGLIPMMWSVRGRKSSRATRRSFPT